MYQKALKLRIFGFVASLILTLVAYVLIVHPDSFRLNAETAIQFIFILALMQSLIQLFCFIDIWREKGPLWNLGVFVSTISVIVIIIAFSIWVMHHLDYNMMP